MIKNKKIQMKSPLLPNEILNRISLILDRKEFDYHGKIKGNKFEMRVKQHSGRFSWHSPSLIKGEILPGVNGSIINISFNWKLTALTKFFFILYYFAILFGVRSFFVRSYSIPTAVLLIIILLVLFLYPIVELSNFKQYYSSDTENLKKIFNIP